MKAAVIYDSKYGNTEQLARVIAEALGTGEDVALLKAGDATERNLAGIDMLVLAGPTQGHGLSPALRDFLSRTPSQAFQDLPTVIFDTRLTWPRLLAGSAAAAGAKQLEKKGARLVAPPESFLVSGGEGPLVEGEQERARAWAKEVRTRIGLATREPVVSM